MIMVEKEICECGHKKETHNRKGECSGVIKWNEVNIPIKMCECKKFKEKS